MRGVTYCEICSQEIRNDEWRKHIISQKHLHFEDKYYCDVCKKTYSFWRYQNGTFQDRCRDAERNHRIYTPISSVSDDITHEMNQNRIKFYSS